MERENNTEVNGRGPFQDVIFHYAHRHLYNYNPPLRSLDDLHSVIRQLHTQGHDINLPQQCSGRTPLYFAAA